MFAEYGLKIAINPNFDFLISRNRMFIHFFGLLQDQVDIVTEYEDTTISIRLKEL
jgi:hypothetical protein